MRSCRWPRALLAVALVHGVAGCFLSNSAPRDSAPDDTPAEPTAGTMAPDEPSVPTGGADAPAEPEAGADAVQDQPMNDGEWIDPVIFHAEPGLAFGPATSFVGDLDGDGLDDFVLSGVGALGDVVSFDRIEGSFYVFYGRESFPPEVEASAADAVLRGVGFALSSPTQRVGPVGDLDGDGLADLIVPGPGWIQIVFGGEARLSGEHAIEDVGVRWTFDDEAAPTFLGPVPIAAAGDVNGDGLDDFALTLTTHSVVSETETTTSITQVAEVFLITGREAWPQGAFDPAWATARFRASDDSMSCRVLAAADMDGDGRTDLLLDDGAVLSVVAGSDAVSGELVPREVGRPIQAFGGVLGRLPDLDGDGRDELEWATFSRSMRYLIYGGEEPAPGDVTAVSLTIEAPLPLSGLAVADFDGDRRPDLLATTIGSGITPGGLHVVHGDGERWSGTLTFDEDNLVIPDAVADDTGALAGHLQSGLRAGGDVDGDGDSEVLTSLLGESVPAPLPATAVLLIPGR